MNLKKHIIPMILIAAFCIAMLATPVSASAEAYDLYVDGIQVTAQNAANVLGDGTASYDAATKTLTLNGADISNTFAKGLAVAGVYTEIAGLTVKLVGENRITLPTKEGGIPDGEECGIYSTKNLEVSGTGKLWSNGYCAVMSEQCLVVKDCEISAGWSCLGSLDDIDVDGATLSAKMILMSNAGGDITLKNTTVTDGGGVMGIYAGAGDVTIENSHVTLHCTAFGVDGDPAIPISLDGSGSTLTVKDSVLDLKSNMYAIKAFHSKCIFEGVSGKIEVVGKAAYGLAFGSTVSLKGCDLDISCRATKEGAWGIGSLSDIGIEDSKLKIDARASEKESAICISGIESPSTNVDIWNSTLELMASGPNAAGIYANNVKLNHSITSIEATANTLDKGAAVGIVAEQGRALVNGGALDVLVSGPAQSGWEVKTAGIYMGSAVLSPEFIEADVKLRGNQALSTYPDLSLYGREYELTVGTAINGEGTIEFKKENIESIRYLHIHPFYAIYFDANGGTGEMAATLKHYGEYTLPANTFVAPAGKVFKGWALTPDGEVLTEATFTPHKDTDLYAIWADLSQSPAHTHDHGTEWKSDAESHWKECACGDKVSLGDHVDGNKNDSCDICGAPYKAGLGAGAVVGIVVGGCAVLCGGGFCLYWFVFKKKKTSGTKPEGTDE